MYDFGGGAWKKRVSETDVKASIKIDMREASDLMIYAWQWRPTVMMTKDDDDVDKSGGGGGGRGGG